MISDFRVVADQAVWFGPVASVPTVWRTLTEIAGGGKRALGRVAGAVNAAADRRLEGVSCLRLDATVVEAHSDKELAEPNFTGFGQHRLLSYGDNTGEPLAGMMRRGGAGSNTTADHIAVPDASLAALPPAYRRRLVVTTDGAGASHGLIGHLDTLATRPGHRLVYSVGRELGARERDAIRLLPERAWQVAIDSDRELRGRRAERACADPGCGAHRSCWIEQAHVAELTALLRAGLRGDQLAAWPASMRIFVRRERPHPGAQPSLFEADDGWRYSPWASNLPTGWPGWRANPAYIDAPHRAPARVEDRIRTGKVTGIGHFPSESFAINSAWLAVCLIAATLPTWPRHLALDADLANADPKTLRFRILHAAARLARSGRRRRLKIAATGPGPRPSPPPGHRSPP